MLIKEVMTAHIASVESGDLLAEAAEVMRDTNVGILPVFEGGRLTGMLTDRDLVIRGIAEGKDPERATVREVMTPRALFVFEDQSIKDAAQMMRNNRVRRLAVLDHDSRLTGMVSTADLPDADRVEADEGSGVVNAAANIGPAEHTNGAVGSGDNTKPT